MMVGNPSTAKITLCTLALHSAILSPRNTIAEEASAAIDANYWIKKRDQRKQYLRRQDGLFTDQLTEQKKQQYFARGVAKGAYGSSRNGELRQSSTSIMYRPPNYSTNRLLKSCQGWHTELNNQDGCSNDLNYLDAWLNVAVKENMFHATLESCCDMFFPGLKCEIYSSHECQSHGNPAPAQSTPTIETTTSSSSSCKWHADIDTQDGCTNDNNYPKEWSRPDMARNLFTDTVEQCCDNFFKDQPCVHYSRGCQGSVRQQYQAEEGCVIPGWHPELEHKDGCSNNENFSKQWLQTEERRKTMFHTSFESCCDMFFKGKKCKRYDLGCRIDMNPFLPTSRPTPPKRTKKPTSKPTTAAPVAAPIYYYINNLGLCIEETEENPRPLSNTQLFLDIPACCSFSPAKEICLAEMTAEFVIPLEPPGPLFYVPYGSSICVDSNEPGMTIPYYITDTYGDHYECCEKASPDLTLCLEPDSESEPRPADLGPDSPEEIQDIFVGITVYGEVVIQLSSVPKYDSPEWSTLKRVLIGTITSVMLKSSLVTAEGFVVDLLTFAGQSFQYRLRRNLSKSAQRIFDSLSPLWTQEKRRATQSQMLQFEMTIHALCDAECQTGSGSLGQEAFDELEHHLDYYVESGAFSSILMQFGQTSGLFDEAEVPYALSAALIYRSAVESSATFSPTWSPTEFIYTGKPTPKPITGSPSTSKPKEKEPTSAPSLSSEPTVGPSLIENGIAKADEECGSAMWHPVDGFRHPICTNDLIYPGLWNSPSARPHFLFETAENCCNYFGFTPHCHVKDVCELDNTETISTEASTGNKATKSQTKWPTPGPTETPTRSITSEPIMLDSWGPIRSVFPLGHDWYVEQSSSRCVQDCEKREGTPCGGLKGEWTESFVTAEECCQKLSWKPFLDCALTAVPTISPSITPSITQPTSKPTREPSETPSLSPATHEPTSPPTSKCGTNKWHFKRGHNWCTNDPFYPPLWDFDPALGMTFLFNSVDECCLANRPGMPCDFKDICDTKSSSCGGQYHPTTPDLKTCSNTGNSYSSAWNNNPAFLFETKEGCCEAFYSASLCFIKDVC